MLNIIYRSFKADDSNGVHETALEAWRYTYRDTFSPTFIENFVNTNYSPKRLMGLLPLLESGQMFFHVAEYEARIAGYCNIVVAGEKAELLRIYLRPNFIGQGVGSNLLQAGEEFLKTNNISTYFCYVHEKNELGKQFYQRSGFQHIQERDKDDEWYMEKILN
ncbi:MAG: GNAT family N-acetyltransferase [Anaerolineales bacterium]|nr:GNAT family N-acetyltransferase [Anaerolineales bacterium]